MFNHTPSQQLPLFNYRYGKSQFEMRAATASYLISILCGVTAHRIFITIGNN